MKKFILNNAMVYNYRRMWPFLKPYAFRALLGIGLTIPVGSLDAAIAAFMRPLMDSMMVEQDASFTRTLPYIIMGFTLVQGILNYSSAYLNGWVGSKITQGIKRKLFDKLLSMDTAYFDKQDSGSIMFRYSNDADLAASGLVNNLKLFLTKLFSSMALVVVLVYNSWQLSVLAVGVLVFMVYPMKVVRKKIRDVMHGTVMHGSNIMTIYNETFSGNKIIHSFTLEDKMRDRFHGTTNQMFHFQMKMIQGSAWLSPVLHFITSLGVALVVGFGGYWITVTKTLTPGTFVAFIAALLLLYTPLKSIGNNFVDIQKSFMAIDRIFELLNMKPDIKSSDGALMLDKVEDSIEFKDVTFSYTPERKVLKNVNFKIKVGQMVALVGNSGGGKTTISSLIPRLYDIQEGEILIDSVNIKEYTIESLRSHIAVVFQDNFLFSGTIRENLSLAGRDISEEMMWQALRNANLDEFVNSLDTKLDTEIGERGMLLSGGQKQRVAIARAFIKDAPIVILDEATSALDNKAEKVVQQALDNLMENRTVIVIAHRLSTIQNADNILVINEGQIIEQGTHDELIKEQGAYYALYATQFKTVADV
ncbi:MAG: ATP-binding cassette domain-containing protein [Deferribacteraceae bacterium]|nr:ATP-binding cassette domain-containing protein [Deferribacteraceae bacterium]